MTDIPGTLRGAVEALEGARAVITDRLGNKLDLRSMSLSDFHVVRAIASARGWLREDEISVPCDNCEALLRVKPSSLLALEPFLDGDLDGDEANDAFEHPWPIPELEIGGKSAVEIRLRDVTVNDALPLFDALAREPLRITSAVVRGLGIASVGDETSSAKIARALARASDDAWSAIVDAFMVAHYSPRLSAWIVCDACDATTPVEAPALREFPEDHAARASRNAQGFPDLASFEWSVRAHADAIFAKLGVTNIDLVLDDEIAAVDDGGAPLLGSYEPGFSEGSGFPTHPPEVRIYYRTFRAMWADDGAYDVEDEIAETIEHELLHHLAFLRGEDPEDERERADIAREVRHRQGETETLRRASREARASLGDFMRRTWPLWIFVAIAIAATVCSSR